MAVETNPRRSLRGALLAAALLAATFGGGHGSSRAPALAAGPSFTVDRLSDSPDDSVGNGVCHVAGGGCSLRAALQEANFNPADSNSISFGSLAGTITPTTALPDLSSSGITIAGLNQQVTIDGSDLPAGTPCLNLNSNGNTVRGIVIAECAGDGIELGGSGNTIGGTSSSQRNVIRNGAQNGIGACGPNGGSAATGNQILGNYVGVNNAGSEAAQNNFGGIFLCYGASGNTIGGSTASARNVISGHWNPGVRLMGAGPNNVIEGNYIGLDVTGSFAIGNGMGVQLDEASSGNYVLDNVISGNWQAGVIVGGLSYSLSGSESDLFANIQLDGHIEVSVSGPQQVYWSADSSGGQVSSWFFDAGVGDQMTVTLTQVGGSCGSGPMWVQHIGSGETVEIPGYSGSCPGDGEVFLYWSEPIGVSSPPYGSAADNVIQGNHIGTNPAGGAAIANGTGIIVMGPSSDTLIGGPNSGDGNLISGNWNAAINGSGSEATVIQGNLIGTDGGGTYAISNGGLGGAVVPGENAVIGGTTPGERNVISGNYTGGVMVDYYSGNATISGNYIGTNAAGEYCIANGGGITIINGGNVVGGTAPGSENLIACNNGPGLFIMWGSSQNSLVQGNEVVFNKSGVVVTEGASHNTIEGNQISGSWNGPGVSIGGLWYTLSGSENWTDPIQLDGALTVLVNGEQFDNYYLDAGEISFQSLVANTGDALELQLLAGADGCGSMGPVWLYHFQTDERVQLTPGIPEVCPGEREEVGSTTYSIEFPADEIETTGNVLHGNKIGTDEAGTVAWPNNRDGVRIIGNSAETEVGGDGAGEGNLISGNNGSGIHIYGGSQNDVIQGNYIGVNQSGTAPIPNIGGLNDAGVQIGAWPALGGSGTLIGGATPGARNVISGNDPAGIDLWISNNVSIKGNYIGANAAGDAPIGNAGQGIRIFVGSDHTIVGGDSAAERNVISGNRCTTVQGGGGGLSMWWGTNNNVVVGNYIGLSADGSKAIPNDCAGVDLYDGSSANEVRGNVISGNNGDGVSVGENQYSLAGADDNFFAQIDLDDHIEVTRNGQPIFSGDADGDSIGNIFLRGKLGDELVITVTSLDACASVGPIWLHNLGSGNVDQVADGASNSCTGQPIVMNYIIAIPVGFSASGNVIEENRIGTNPSGVALPNQGDGIGLRGSSSNTIIGTPGHGNVIAFSGGNGVSVGGASSIRNTIRGNSIHSNLEYGISLWDGGNTELPAPVITSPGPVAGTACANCTVDVYSDSEDEGRIYEGSTTASGSGNFTFAGAVSGPAVTATATDAAGNTSEFSDPLRLRLLGDVNGSGGVSMVDAMLIAQCVAGLIDCDSIDGTMGDVNCSGGLSMVDAMLVAQYVVGLVSEFPVCGP